jgi:glycosyltransferase involved in cell wall biosynthesis
MNVLMVTSSYPKFTGDVTAPFIESIARAVAARGHDVDVVLPHHPELRRQRDEPVRFFPYRYSPRDEWSVWGYAQSLEADVKVRKAAYLLAPFVALALRAAVSERLKSRQYDAVHAHWVIPNAAFISGLLHVQGMPLVVSLHGSDVFLAERMALARRLAGRAFQTAGAVTACSGDLHQRALALGARPKATRTVPYGVDVHGFSPETPRAGIRERLAVPDNAFLVLALGRLVEKKGFVHLVDAAAKTGGIRVVIAGDGDLRPSLEERARSLKAPVTFTGNLDRETVAAALAEADVVVVPSVVDRAGNVDGLPNTLLEAMASGCAVVASRVAGIPDVIEDGRNGILVPEKDPDALAAALRRLAREPETRLALAGEARRTAVESLSWEAAGRRFEECYVQAASMDTR